MSKLSEPFHAEEYPKEKRMDAIFNHMRAQLDFLCGVAEIYLDSLNQDSDDRGNKSENTDYKGDGGNNCG